MSDSASDRHAPDSPQASNAGGLLTDLAARAGIAARHVIPYGRDVAKIDLGALMGAGEDPAQESAEAGANYVVITAITPTPFGEGKTTTAIGLAQGLAAVGEQAVLTLRQGAMGPTFGIKGGAGGAGRARLLPADRVGLHLTGDFHAVTAAHNLLSAIIDNHLHHGNALGIEERTITWPRVLDVNDRALRHIVTGLGTKADGVTRQASFDITPASEVMVILSLATDLADLRRRLGRIVIGRTRQGDWVTAEDLGAAGAMCAILREALEPNLVRTGEGVPVLLHTGPFGNIATGCSSVIADRLAAHGMRQGGYVLTEAGFGADMGLERFVDLKCAVSGMRPRAAVLVVSVRALKAHSGRYRLTPGKDLPEGMLAESPQEVRQGAENLLKHLGIVRGLGLSPVVAINVFPTDHPSEIAEIEAIARRAGARAAACHPVAQGGAGCTELARAVVEACRQAAGAPTALQPLYQPQEDLRTKIGAIAAMYGADGVDYTPAATRLLEDYEAAGFGDLPVLVAKTPLSLSAEPGLKGAPTGWRLPVREVRLAAGAGYVYAICGSLSTMPGLPTRPAAERIDVDIETGEIQGLR
ncbi:formate--tetrahydrofolate ligase [Actinomyces bowdenii]|uniref:Formate--tetrahydrofolate ligase n=1 Tax=Actinomyces bowdenii TaxID=131109 RepID=A0A853EFG6_9ACTO|nr:formate--tetrahydrofolate ligase [Actinomyces bowdenii]MBF0695895.1 formate--tetrahydrofolate ligase [Actinomyces bowdenii]NYS68068.1 formate--tetrahydrofolate ligase [Actinomyces bowdenii]